MKEKVKLQFINLIESRKKMTKDCLFNGRKTNYIRKFNSQIQLFNESNEKKNKQKNQCENLHYKFIISLFENRMNSRKIHQLYSMMIIKQT